VITIEEQEKSGLRVGEFARRHGIEPARLTWWRGEIRRRITRTTRTSADVTFTEAVVVDRGPAATVPIGTIVVDLGHGRRIEVPPNFDEGALRLLIGVLGSC
jgi:hypothetical protein